MLWRRIWRSKIMPWAKWFLPSHSERNNWLDLSTPSIGVSWMRSKSSSIAMANPTIITPLQLLHVNTSYISQSRLCHIQIELAKWHQMSMKRDWRDIILGLSPMTTAPRTMQMSTSCWSCFHRCGWSWDLANIPLYEWMCRCTCNGFGYAFTFFNIKIVCLVSLVNTYFFYWNGVLALPNFGIFSCVQTFDWVYLEKETIIPLLHSTLCAPLLPNLKGIRVV